MSPAMPSNATDSISPAAISTSAAAAHPAGAALLLGALGVVFGDIGTSPIYAFRERLRIPVLMVGLAGASLFFGDAMITPAISVLSAVEGLAVATPIFKPYVVPIAAVVLVGLFAIQSHGSAQMGRLFGPVT